MRLFSVSIRTCPPDVALNLKFIFLNDKSFFIACIRCLEVSNSKVGAGVRPCHQGPRLFLCFCFALPSRSATLSRCISKWLLWRLRASSYRHSEKEGRRQDQKELSHLHLFHFRGKLLSRSPQQTFLPISLAKIESYDHL